MKCPWRECLLLEIVDAISNIHLDAHSVQSSTTDAISNAWTAVIQETEKMDDECLQNAFQNPTIPVSGSYSLRPLPCSSGVQPDSTQSNAVYSAKRDRSPGPGCRENSPKHDSVNTNDQKTLKVRIKVGPDNALARKNAAIYSGLGLDISPPSSLEDSPYGSGELSPDLQVAPDESPMTIIQGVMMTHSNVLATVSVAMPIIPGLGGKDIYLAYLPRAHILELVAERRVEDLDNYSKAGFMLFNSCTTMTILLQEVVAF